MLSGESEVVLGELQVITRLAMGSERLRLLLTSRRIIIAHVGKRGAGAVTATSLLGRLSVALEDLFKRGRESLSIRKAEAMSPEEVIAADEDNFAISLEDIVNAKLEETPNWTRLTVLTKNEKLEFLTSLKLTWVVGLLEGALGPKLTL
jgi:hypothetical protein